jgi:hypothetical protein
MNKNTLTPPSMRRTRSYSYSYSSYWNVKLSLLSPQQYVVTSTTTTTSLEQASFPYYVHSNTNQYQSSFDLGAFTQQDKQ